MTELENDTKGVSRRGFLHGAGVGAVAVAGAGVMTNAIAAPQEGCKSAGCDYDVLVIGGGFAGVTAARDSRKSGYRTLLLEARNRLGERTFSAEFAGHKVELGGTWIHWSQPFVWAEKERYGLQVKETPGNAVLATEKFMVKVGDKLETVSGEGMLELLAGFDQFFAEGREVWDRPYDSKFTWDKLIKRDGMSARDRFAQIQLSPLQRTVVDGYLAAMGHCPSDQVSYNEVLRWWSLPGWNLPTTNDALARYTFKDGTVSLVNAMIEDGKPTYASYRPNWYEKYYDHFQKDWGRIVFGQGDHGEGWRGFIDGAIGAGGQAAKRVKELLG